MILALRRRLMWRRAIVVPVAAMVIGLIGARAGDTPAVPPGAAHPEATTFAQANKLAMDKMMADMDVTPTGDVDADFVAMMVSHHQGAIDMAVAVLRYGKNEAIRRTAQEIVVTQQQEIAAMRLAVDRPISSPMAGPMQLPASTGHKH